MNDNSDRTKMLDRTIDVANEVKDRLPSMMMDFLDAVRKVGIRFKDASPENKRMIVTTLCANFKWDGEKLVWKWRKPYHVLTNAEEKINWLRDQDSNLGPND